MCVHERYRSYSWEIRRRLEWLYRRVESVVLEYEMACTPDAGDTDSAGSAGITQPYHVRIASEREDLSDIVSSFPDKLGFPTSATPRAVLRAEIAERFRSGITCFVARHNATNQLLGALWSAQCDFRGFLPVEKRLGNSLKFYNLYVIPETRGLGVRTALLRYAVAYVRRPGIEFLYALVAPERIPSLRAFLGAGFKILGTGIHGMVLGRKVEKYRRTIRLKSGAFPIVPAVIVTTIEHDGSTLLGTIRALGRCGIPVYVLARGPLTYAGKTRYAHNVELFGGDISDEDLVRRLTVTLRAIGQQTSKPVLVHVSENDIYRLRSIKPFLDQHFSVLPSDNVFLYLEKSNQLPLAEKAGFKVPRSTILRNRHDLVGIADELAYPVIVKPLARHTTGAFTEKALVFESAAELVERVSAAFDDPQTELIAQEYIQGDDRNVLVFMGSCGPRGEVRVCVSGRKLLQNPPGRGMMASGIIDRNDAMETMSKRLCALMGVQGFIGIEAKQRAGTDDLFYIESSFRPEAFNALAEAAGTNLVFDAYLCALNQPCFVPPPGPTGSFLNLQYEIDATRELVRAGKARWRRMLKPLPRPTAYSLFAADDPFPFLRWLADAAWLKALRIVHLK